MWVFRQKLVFPQLLVRLTIQPLIDNPLLCGGVSDIASCSKIFADTLSDSTKFPQCQFYSFRNEFGTAFETILLLRNVNAGIFQLAANSYAFLSSGVLCKEYAILVSYYFPSKTNFRMENIRFSSRRFCFSSLQSSWCLVLNKCRVSSQFGSLRWRVRIPLSAIFFSKSFQKLVNMFLLLTTKLRVFSDVSGTNCSLSKIFKI